MKKLILTGAVISAVALILSLTLFFILPQNREYRIVLIEPGARLATIATTLHEEGAIRHPRLFKALARIRGRHNSLRAGEFQIPARASLNRVLGIIVSGRGHNRFITIPEGLTARQVRYLLYSVEELTGPVPAFTDGDILPETYAFIRGSSRADLVARMRRAMETTLEYEWNNRAPGLPFRTPHEALVLASIIERETHVDAERPKVAAVFVSRLRQGWRLQADATVIFAITDRLGDMQGRQLFSRDLRFESPYNTYVVRGLPPGPICNPGRASIRAALNPADVEYMFFVANGTGGHTFSVDLATHEYHRARWRIIRDAARN